MLPEGTRRRWLAEAAERLFAVAFAERILAFDSEASPVPSTPLALRGVEA